MKNCIFFIFFVSSILVSCNESDSFDTETNSGIEYMFSNEETYNTANATAIVISNLGKYKLMPDGTLSDEGKKTFELFKSQNQHLLVTFLDYETLKVEKNSEIDNNFEHIPVEEDNNNVSLRCANSFVRFYDDKFLEDRELEVEISTDCYQVTPTPLLFCQADASMHDTWSTSPVQLGYNDKCSSFILANTCSSSSQLRTYRLTMFDDINFEDTSLSFDVLPNTLGVAADLGFFGFNDKMSSYFIRAL